MCWRRRAVQGPRSWEEAGLVPRGLLTTSWRKGRGSHGRGPPGQRRVFPTLSTLFFSLMEEEFTDSNSMAQYPNFLYDVKWII